MLPYHRDLIDFDFEERVVRLDEGTVYNACHS